MVIYNFKSIQTVPTAKDFVDIVLSKTQRKTPTVVHQGYAISRIRKFYMRKVKFTQTSIHEKLTSMLDTFPRLDSVHPFYADLINVLYSRDHYKLALGQLSTAKTLIDGVGRDYLKLLKFADSLYRSKELKRAALGRMCTIVLKLGPSLAYLEQVRQHLSRLPNIDPSSKTLLITGFPNVGKSSFINKVSHANVEVQPYAFTTKSLFVGHFDYEYNRWQILDTPGILDHSLEERNTIEMQAVIALAHLPATILFFLDLSEECGYSVERQINLFEGTKALFAHKPLVLVCSKSDLKTIEQMPKEDREKIESLLEQHANAKMLSLSTLTETGITTVLNTACDMLMSQRLERKMKHLTAGQSNKMNEIANRLVITRPVMRDNKVRAVSIPETVHKEKELRKQASILAETDPEAALRLLPRMKLEREIEVENGGPGIYFADIKKHHMLDKEEWRYDFVPEIMDGKNIADFIDPDIERRLAELEREEESILSKEAQMKALGEERKRKREAKERGEEVSDISEDDDEDEDSELDEELREKGEMIRKNRKLIMNDRRMMKTNNKAVLPRTVQAGRRDINVAADFLEARRINSERFEEIARIGDKKMKERRKRNIEGIEGGIDVSDDEAEMEDGNDQETAEQRRKRLIAKAHSVAKRKEDEEQDEQESREDREEEDDFESESDDEYEDMSEKGSSRGLRERKVRGSSSTDASRSRSRSRSHSVSSISRSQSRFQRLNLTKIGRDHKRVSSPSPFRDVDQKIMSERLRKIKQRDIKLKAAKGDADRTYLDPKPKHLFSGKTTIGKKDRR
jgi:nucleolar GTP-binding protein